MSFIQVDPEFVVEINNTVNNTGEDIMWKKARIPFLSQITMALVDTENNSAGEDYFPPLKTFQTCSSQSQYELSLSEDMLSHILKQFHSGIPDAELEDSILKCNPIPSNVPPPALLDEFLRVV